MKVSKEKVVSSRSYTIVVQVWHPIDTADGSFGPCRPSVYFRVSRSGRMDACISGMKLIGMLSSVKATYKGSWIRARSGEGYEESSTDGERAEFAPRNFGGERSE